MNDSQSSDFFSETGMSINDEHSIDVETYNTLFNKIKTSLSSTSKNKRKYEEICNILLDDSRSCANQSFNIILSLLEDTTGDIDKVCSYIDNVVEILRILSIFIKGLIETIPLTCRSIKTFPTYTGSMIAAVFSHCKDSEFIYENHLSSVEKQLKELFRSCHELQLTYLLIMQKHFLFDLNVKDDQDVLLEALDINLQIGEIVQALDVKTMAEQWKGYTFICEKYSNFLLVKNIFNNSSKLLASTIEKNVKAVLESEEGDKIVIRSLKVARFSLKILLKISDIFKGADSNDYSCIIQLLSYIKLCDSNYHELLSNKSSDLTTIMFGHLSPPSEAIIVNLINDGNFLKNVLALDSIDNKDGKFLGYVLILISVMKALPPHNTNGTKSTILNKVYSIIPKCHVWFNVGVKFPCASSPDVCRGLYEHLMVHTTALVSTMTNDEYNEVERTLIKYILAPECYAAMFSANLWIILCRMGNYQLHINVLQNLIIIYQKLEAHEHFFFSSQEVNLRYAIGKLFKTLKDPEKMGIIKTYNLQDNGNTGVWCALRVDSLPENVEIVTEKLVIEKLLATYNGVCEHIEVDKLIKYLQLASTCSFVVNYTGLEDLLVALWSEYCILCNKAKLQHLEMGSIEHVIYLKSLTNLTNTYKNKFESSYNVVKILTTMSKILQLKTLELTTILLETFCELLYHSEQDRHIEDILTNTLKTFKNEQNTQQAMFQMFLTNNEMYHFIVSFLNKDPSLVDIKEGFDKHKQENINVFKWKEQLEMASGYSFVHKCIENRQQNCVSQQNCFGNFDGIFAHEEPANKKAKYCTNVEDLICALEYNTVQLSQTNKHTLSAEHKNRIKNSCEKLRNIIV